MMMSKMNSTTNKANEEPTPPLYALPMKATTFLSSYCTICSKIYLCIGECHESHESSLHVKEEKTRVILKESNLV